MKNQDLLDVLGEIDPAFVENYALPDVQQADAARVPPGQHLTRTNQPRPHLSPRAGIAAAVVGLCLLANIGILFGLRHFRTDAVIPATPDVQDEIAVETADSSTAPYVADFIALRDAALAKDPYDKSQWTEWFELPDYNEIRVQDADMNDYTYSYGSLRSWWAAPNAEAAEGEPLPAEQLQAIAEAILPELCSDPSKYTLDPPDPDAMDNKYLWVAYTGGARTNDIVSVHLRDDGTVSHFALERTDLPETPATEEDIRAAVETWTRSMEDEGKQVLATNVITVRMDIKNEEYGIDLMAEFTDADGETKHASFWLPLN